MVTPNLHPVDFLALAKKHIEIQRARIAQQDLIARLELEDDPKRLRLARELLKQMTDLLKRLLAKYTVAKNRIDQQKQKKRLA